MNDFIVQKHQNIYFYVHMKIMYYTCIDVASDIKVKAIYG